MSRKTNTSLSSMTNPLLAGLAKATNYTLTENLALTHRSTLNPLLDWYAAGGAIRSRDEASIISLFSKAWAENPLKALKVLFYLRDVREGQGERRTFRICLNWLANNRPDVVLTNFDNIPFYGRWDDVYWLLDTPVEGAVIAQLKSQLVKDLEDAEAGKPISLLAKWMKSENTSSKESRKLARRIREAFNWSARYYRKNLSFLRRYINVVEVKMCSGEWADINFEAVPSKATLRYKKAFQNHEENRWKAYLAAVEKGEKKINAGAVYPYELLQAIIKDELTPEAIKAVDLQWKNQPNWLAENPHRGLVLADCSGSMAMFNGLPMAVAVSLAIYFAERNVGPFQNCFMTFSSHCQLQRLIGNNLRERAQNLMSEGWCGSTNLQSAFDAILTTAVANKVKEEDMPSVLYIISDMEFNMACQDNSKTNFQVAKDKFAKAGYNFPKIVFWDVAARNDQSPITEDENGVCLVSGCSPSILKSVLSSKEFDPMSILEETIGQERYNRVVV